MKKSSWLQIKWKTFMGALILLAALTIGFHESLIVSLADSAGKITASSAKIRKEPNTSSETVGSAVQDAKVSVTGQITGSDGYTWYKVMVDGGTAGYIRSDLMEITDGSTPASVVAPTTTPTSTPTTSTPDETLVDVADVEPVSANVKGSSPVRVRQNASTTSRIVTNAEGGMALTVIGQATGSDNKDWYLVQFIANGSEVSGFIRADYVNLSGELVPAGSAEKEPVEQTQEVPEEPEEEVKMWETTYTEEDSRWHLVNNETKESYDIEQIFTANAANAKTLEDVLKEKNKQQIVIIVLVILAVFLATGISVLFFKLKDLTDAAYYNEVEQETMRRRTADRPAAKGQGSQRPAGGQGNRPVEKRPASAQGGQRPAGSQGGRPTGQRPANAQGGQRPAGSQGSRPVGQRPANAQGGQRPAGSQGGRPTGQRPASAQGGQRPAGSQGNRPVGQRPANAQGGQHPAGSQGDRPTDKRPTPVKTRPVQAPEEEMVQNIFTDDTVVYDRADVQQAVKASEQIQQEEKTGWKAKNFTNEDELEFHFLNLEDSDN